MSEDNEKSNLEEKLLSYNEQFNESNAIVDPTSITISGIGLNIIATSMLFFDSTRVLSPIFYGLSVICDKLDGSVAEKFKLKTLEGAKLDPLADKINFLIPFVYFAPELAENGHYLPLALAFVNQGYNYLSQRFRGEILPQIEEAYETLFNIKNQTLSDKNGNQAVWSGKLKAGFQAGTIIGLSLASAGWLDFAKEIIEPELFDFAFYNILAPASLGIAAYNAHKNVSNKKSLSQILDLVKMDLYKVSFEISDIGRKIGF